MKKYIENFPVLFTGSEMLVLFCPLGVLADDIRLGIIALLDLVEVSANFVTSRVK